jgi:hypothetical protein
MRWAGYVARRILFDKSEGINQLEGKRHDLRGGIELKWISKK